MAVKAKQQYYADETTIKKEAREFGMIDELKDKLDSIEYGAQVNIIEEVQENGVPLEIVDKSVNVLVPEVIDNLYTIDPNNSLSAKQGKILYDMIKNLLARGRFLSTWNTATGLPVTNPEESPYEYKAGDYYIVGIVAAEGGTNFRPEPGEYVINVASDEQETSEVHVSDIYVYDGEKWILLINSTREIAVDDYVDHTYQSTNPVENQAIAREIDTKQNKFYTVSTTSPSNPTEGDEWYDATNDKVFYWDGTQWKEMGGGGSTYTAGLHISIDPNDNNKISVVEWSATSSALGLVKLGSDTRQTVTPNNVSSTAGRTYRIQTNDSGQLMVNVPWTDNNTTYTAGTGINIDTSNNNRINCTIKPVHVGSTAPANPGTGDLWYDTTKNTMFLYKNNAWTIIGPEIFPITKANYDALSQAEQNDGRFFLITDNDGTIYVDWENVQGRIVYSSATSPSGPENGWIWYNTSDGLLYAYDGVQETWNQIGGGSGGSYTAGDGIDIDANNEISVDVTDIIGTGLSEDANNNIIVDTTVVATQTDLASKQDKATSGSGAPSTTPTYVGQVYIDTTNDNMYVATGTSSSSDWTAVDTNTTYRAGNGINISNDEISIDTTVVATKTDLSSKQDTISDLATIRSGASAGATAIQPNDNVSTLTNDAGYITNAVNDLTNYYTKTQTYTKAEVDQMISDFGGFEVVETLPTENIKTNVIYLKGPIGTGGDKYEEWIYSNSQWVLIGETSVDLSNYFNTFTDTSDRITEGSTNLFVTSSEKSTWNAKQDTISDLVTIRSGASAGATAIQPNDNVSELTNDAGYITSSALDDYSTTTEMNNAISTATSGLATESYVDTALASKQDTLTAGDGIDIDANNEISVDVTDIIGTGLSEDANNNIIVDSTVVALKSDLTNYYTKTETYTKTEVDNLISSFGNFEVVSSLPSVSTASEKTIYLLGPIGKGADKYEEWIVTGTNQWSSASTVNHDSVSGEARHGNRETIWNDSGTINNVYVGIDNLVVTNEYESFARFIEVAESTDVGSGTEIQNGDPMPWISQNSYTTPVLSILNDMMTTTASCDVYYSASPLTYGPVKQWTKIGETSVDLSNYAQKSEVLTKTNTTAFTPTGDYQPATKKYVDDNKGKNDIVSSPSAPSDHLVIWQDLGYYDWKLYNNSESSFLPIMQYKKGSTAPSDYGMLWYDDNNHQWKAYNFSTYAWEPIVTNISGKQDKATSGSAAPSTTPSYVGEMYVDTTNDILYVATGTSSSSDWTEVGAGSGDVLYSDFGWETLTGASVTLALRGEITPSANFTVNAPATIKDGQFYVLRVDNGATAYTMTLGTGVTNPYSEDLTLVANNIQQFMFLAKGGNLELQPSTEIDISGKQDKATSGSAAPSTTPSYIGQQYVDTTNDKLYVATGTTSSSDWIEIGAGGGFEVVSTLPSVAQADENKIYVLGPIGTGTDKYEEWIVTEEYGTSGTTDSVGWMMQNQVGPTINYVLINTNQLDGLYLSLNNVGLESGNSISSISFGTDTYTEVPANLGLFTYGTSPERFSIEFSNVPTDSSVYSLTIDSSTSVWGNQKVWTKIGETSINAGDMLYADFNWVSKTGATVTLDLNSTITPSANFTVNAPSTIKDGQVYILRVVNGATAYTMTLGTGITNPYSTSTTLTANGVDQFVFQAIGGNLELLPDSDVDITGKQDKATSGSTAPSSTPSYVGQQYIDTTNNKMYFASGTSSSSDWTEVGAGGGGNVIAMTQSEYNALSTAEKNDGKLRIITDAPTEDISVDWTNVANKPIDISAQTGTLSSVKIWVGTQTAYNNLGSYDANTLYFTTNVVSGS